jgi:dTDP-4-dehydrorhamnose reductase
MKSKAEGSVLILGGSGFLGRYVAEALGKRAIIHTTKTNSKENFHESRFESPTQICKFMESFEFNHVINCIAMADLDKCNLEPEHAMWLNAEIPSVVSNFCKSNKIELTHISTDAVYSGQMSFASELHQPNPISMYGISKLKGESNVRSIFPNSKVVRVNFYGWNYREKSLFNFVYNNLRMGKTITGFDDVYFTPLFAGHTAEIIVRLSTFREPGIFHVVGNERISKYDFCVRVAKEFGFDSKLVIKGAISESPLGMNRSKDLSLSNAKIRELQVRVPTLEEGIDALKNEMRNLLETN